MRYFKLLTALIMVLVSSQALPSATLGNPKAPIGGTFVQGIGAYPKSILYYISNDVYAAEISSLIFESLVERNPETYQLIPALATSWEESKDHMTFTFKINPKARFSDGKPVTAHDVKFTWDVIQNPKNNTVPMRVALTSIASCEVVDDLTVKFHAKTLHYKNFDKAASMMVLPKHFFEKGDFNRDFHNKLLGSGAYILHKAERGEKVILRRDPKYWGWMLDQNKGRYNFEELVFKAVGDYNVQYEMFKRGDFDLFEFYVSKMWITETNGPLYDKKLIKKMRIENSEPRGMQGIAWNLRRPLFQDIRVRKALALLMNRKQWIEDLFYNQYKLSKGIIQLDSEYQDPSIVPVPYDPSAAKKLLNEAGWSQTDSSGILVKDGKRFEFELLENSDAGMRYLTRYQEDLKKMGIQMNIRVVDWTTAIKLVEDRKYDARALAYTRGVEPSDFASMWGSEAADTKGSSNFTGYKNPAADKLCLEIDQTFDKKKRIPLVHKLAKMIFDEHLVAWGWELAFGRVAYWDKFSFPGKGYFKYSSPRDMIHYWWYDAEKAKSLEEKRKKL